ncbi:MAG: recombinase family protein [Desulfobacteraceae bacterium]|nr:recombinase family protein [Desulfobacteraceae bacterium]
MMIKRLSMYCRKGDTLHIHSMDRLARNLKDLLRIVDELTAQGTSVKFHKESLTFNGQEDPMSKLMLQVMGAVAEFERSLILDRQKEGIKKALEKGVRFGPKPVVGNEKLQLIIQMMRSGKPKTEIAQELKISRQSLYKALKANQVEVIQQIKAPGIPI